MAVTCQAKYELQASATSLSDELGPWLPSIPRKWQAFQRKKEKSMGTFLSERELSGLSALDNTAFPSPVPMQMVSNGEFNPLPQIRGSAQSRRPPQRPCRRKRTQAWSGPAPVPTLHLRHGRCLRRHERSFRTAVQRRSGRGERTGGWRRARCRPCPTSSSSMTSFTSCATTIRSKASWGWRIMPRIT